MKRLLLFPFLILIILSVSAFAQEEEEGKVIGGRRIDEIIRTNVPQPEGSKVTLDERTGTLIVTNTPTNLKKIEEIIEVVDKPPTQVLIDMRFIEVSEQALEDIGIHWPNIDMKKLKNATGIGSIGFGGRSSHRSSDFSDFASEGLELDVSGIWKADAYNYNFILRALKQTGMADTLASPRITTLNNQEAIIEVVTERTFLSADSDYTEAKWEDGLIKSGDVYYPYPVYIADVPNDLVQSQYGITLTVTPEVGEKFITLNLDPEIKEFMGTGSYGFVKWGYRDINTRVVIEDGQTVIMGGLLSEEETVSKTKVPLLGDVPLLGKLFQRNITEKSRKNLLIFVTVHLLTPSGDRLLE